MITIKDLIGKPVVAVDTGDKIGTVSDALFEEDAGAGAPAVVALVLGGGVLAREHVMPFREVQTIGGDTILAKSHTAVVGGREWRDRGTPSARTSTLKGRPVVSTAGQRLGEVSDLLIDGETGAFAALEFATSGLGGLRTRRSLVQPVAGVKIGPDAVLVPEDAVRHHDREAHDRAAADAPVTDAPRIE